MFRTLFAAMVAAVLLAPAASAVDLSVPALATEERPGTGQYIVGFYEMPDLQPGDSYADATVLSTTPELGFITVMPADLGLFQVKTTLDENVRYVETDVSDHTLQFTPNDYFTNHVANYGYWKINANLAHDRTLGTTAVKEGHIDSGMNWGHEDLQGARFIKGKDWYNNDATPDDTSGCSYHGTHTTGTAAATINNAKGFPGISQSNVYVQKIFGGGRCFATTTTNIANALKATRDNGAHVSSNSWGGGSYSQAIHDAITYAVSGGVTIVAAAGNDGCSNCIGNPWKTQEGSVIIVTATDTNDAGASFNSKGPETDVAAPGVSIGSAASGTAGYVYMSGTSMATPYVAGVACLIKTLNPSMTPSQIQSRLKSTAVDLGPAGEDDTFGAGRIDANAAVF